MTSFQFVEKMDVTCTDDQKKFDTVIGVIEDIIMTDDFQEMQTTFMEKHYNEFEDTEENKFIYTDIFREYGAIIENYLEGQLTARLPGFKMDKFLKSLQTHRSEISEEIFDMFVTFTDFIAFKELFIDYKSQKEGKNVDLMQSFVVHSYGN